MVQLVPWCRPGGGPAKARVCPGLRAQKWTEAMGPVKVEVSEIVLDMLDRLKYV